MSTITTIPPDAATQAGLDATGTFVVPRNTAATPLMLPQPLFMPIAGSMVGDDIGPSWVDCWNAGHGVISGWPRGRVSDAHFPESGGYRTLGDSYPIDVGGEWSLGPMGPGEKGWGSVSRLKIEIDVTKHYAGNWGFSVLGGINAFEGYGPFPSPWVAWVESDGFAHLHIRTQDGVIRDHHLAVTASDNSLSLSWDLDLEALYGPGSRLAPNTQWPCGIGQAPPSPGANGFWGNGNARDMTFTKFAVTSNTTLRRADFIRIPTYDGGPSLPLMQIWGSYTRSMLIWHNSQGVSDSVNGVTIRGISFKGFGGHATVNIGACQGGVPVGVAIDRCVIQGGSRGVQSLANAVHYPLMIRDSAIRSNGDCNLWLFRASGVLIDNTQLDYGERCAAELIGCNNTVIRGPLVMAPPGPPGQESVFIQRGGNVRYVELGSNYEYEVPDTLAMVALQPATFDLPWFVTAARVEGCFNDKMKQAVRILPRQPGYAAETQITLSGCPAKWRKVRIGNELATVADGGTLMM